MHLVPELGAAVDPHGVTFRVHAPNRARMSVVIYGRSGAPEREIPMDREGDTFVKRVEGLKTGARYKYQVEGVGPLPDPLSRSQPDGPHGASEVVDCIYPWSDAAWRGISIEQAIIYELHVGTFSHEGTFEGVANRLDELVDLGVTAIELMPIASFPGRWNWGYDGVAWYAPAAVYGGPRGLMQLVDRAHAKGVAVLLDVVYNHFGPDGNYLPSYWDKYFTSKHQTPWGQGINYDDEGREVVREIVLRNVEMWIRDYHLDGLRLDATHAIQDDSTPNLLQEIARRAKEAAKGRSVLVVAEDERNDARVVCDWGLDGVWADDFHHQLRRLIAGDHEGYFADFSDDFEDLVKALDQGWLYIGQYAEHFGRNRGSSPIRVPPPAFVHAIQNHDQIGNRAQGDRLGAVVPPNMVRALQTLICLTPYTPLLFMGQEWNATTPFQYFTDHEPELGRKVTEGRRSEFSHFEDFSGDVPDPQDPSTFVRSKLDRSELMLPMHAGMRALTKELLHLRKTHEQLQRRDRGSFTVKRVGERALLLGRGALDVLVNLGGAIEVAIEPHKVLLDSEDARFAGGGRVTVMEGAVRMDGPAAIVFEALKR